LDSQKTKADEEKMSNPKSSINIINPAARNKKRPGTVESDPNIADDLVRITKQPQDVSVTAPELASIFLVAENAAAFQWFKFVAEEWQAIPNTDSPTLEFDPSSSADEGDYRCEVTGLVGDLTISSSARITVSTVSAPVFTQEPAGETVVAGNQVSLFVAVTGTQPISLQWRKDGTPISGATSSTYNFTPFLASEGGDFDCVATNPGGETTSSVATVIVTPLSAPSFTLNPSNETANVGDLVTLEVAVIGSEPISLQWRKNSVPISGATSLTYQFTPLSGNDGGIFDCVATNAAGSVISNSATVTVNITLPSFTQQPSDFLGSLSVPNNAEFSVAGDNIDSVQWQTSPPGANTWSDIPGANATTLNIVDVQNSAEQDVRCLATNGDGSTASQTAELTLFDFTPKWHWSNMRTPAGNDADQTFLGGVTNSRGVVRRWDWKAVETNASTELVGDFDFTPIFDALDFCLNDGGGYQLAAFIQWKTFTGNADANDPAPQWIHDENLSSVRPASSSPDGWSCHMYDPRVQSAWIRMNEAMSLAVSSTGGPTDGLTLSEIPQFAGLTMQETAIGLNITNSQLDDYVSGLIDMCNAMCDAFPLRRMIHFCNALKGNTVQTERLYDIAVACYITSGRTNYVFGSPDTLPGKITLIDDDRIMGVYRRLLANYPEIPLSCSLQNDDFSYNPALNGGYPPPSGSFWALEESAFWAQENIGVDSLYINHRVSGTQKYDPAAIDLMAAQPDWPVMRLRLVDTKKFDAPSGWSISGFDTPAIDSSQLDAEDDRTSYSLFERNNGGVAEVHKIEQSMSRAALQADDNDFESGETYMFWFTVNGDNYNRSKFRIEVKLIDGTTGNAQFDTSTMTATPGFLADDARIFELMRGDYMLQVDFVMPVDTQSAVVQRLKTLDSGGNQSYVASAAQASRIGRAGNCQKVRV